MADNSNSSGNQGAGQQKPSLSWSQPTTPQASTVRPIAPTSATVKTSPNNAQASLTQGSSNMGIYVGIFAAGLIVGALIGWGITSSRTNDTSITASSTVMMATTTTNSSSSTAAATKTSSSTGDITLSSPEQAGFAVGVSKVSVTQPTWLVVYEDNNGLPGNAIGAGLFFADSTSGTIQLLRATLPGQSYLVGESLDDGDKMFSLATDKPVRDEKGNPLFTEFTAQ